MDEERHKRSESYRERLRSGGRLIGCFLKTPTGHATEILGDVGYDFVVIDEEHATFGRMETDTAILAAHAAGIAAIVRVQTGEPRDVMPALDGGAAGILVPHVATGAAARLAVASAHFKGGTRGFSNSPRAGRYGALSMRDHVAAGDALATVIAQIEDPEALDHLDEILDVEGVDAIFVGRGDLSVALGADSVNDQRVRDAVEQITAAARGRKPICVLANGPEDANQMLGLGASVFILGTDQGFLRQAAGTAFHQWLRP